MSLYFVLATIVVYALSVVLIGLPLAKRSLDSVREETLSIDFPVMYWRGLVYWDVDILRPLLWTPFKDQVTNETWTDGRYTVTVAYLWLPFVLAAAFRLLVVIIVIIVVGICLGFSMLRRA